MPPSGTGPENAACSADRSGALPRTFRVIHGTHAQNNRNPVGLIYADSDRSETLRFKPEELSLLKTLRNQAVLAIRQKS